MSLITGEDEAVKKTVCSHLQWACIQSGEIALESKDTSVLLVVFKMMYAFSVVTLRSF
jgi:hypothetical protein